MPHLESPWVWLFWCIIPIVKKLFWSLTYQDAMEWVSCALGDAIVMDNRSGETLAIRFA